MNQQLLDLVFSLVKIIVYTFYSDLHIIVFEKVLKSEYISEHELSKLTNVSFKKIRTITSSLYNEKFIKYEDRFFKQIKICSLKSKKIYKLRYWFVDLDFTIKSINKKIRHIFSENKKYILEKIFFFKCPRKICSRIYYFNEILSLPFNYTKSAFLCNQFLNSKVICGSVLEDIDNLTENTNLSSKNSKPENNHHLKIIIELLCKINYLFRLKKTT